MNNAVKMFKILSIDGGGIKGLYSSTIIEHLEKKHGTISDYFDMFCGTSTGGLIALGLSLKIPALELSKIYSEKGEFIFPKRSKFKNIFKQIFWGGKYCDKSLRKILEDVFGNLTISESNNLLCIPSYSYTDSKPWIFKYDHTILSRDNKTKYVDVALATSAAPTYFPLAEISNYNSKQFIDGGVWANNPALIGLSEALKFFVGEGKQYDGVQILSISSLSNNSGNPIGVKRNRSFLNWRDDLFETSLIGQNYFTHYFLDNLKMISNVPIEYIRIHSETIAANQEKLVQLDNADKKAINFIIGKGNDRGMLSTKDENINKFFQTKKTFKL